MKKVILIIALIVLSLSVMYFVFFSTIGIVFNGDDEVLTSFSTKYRTIAAVTDKGNVYVKGEISSNFNYGIDYVRQYNHRLVDKYARIYDKHDAVSVMISGSGGCIITNKSEVYIFLNDSKEYRVPTYFCSGYVKAYSSGENIYLLSDDGTFGFINIHSPDVFNNIGSKVVNFEIEQSYSNGEYDYNAIFALTENNRLYVLEQGEKLADNNRYIDGIIAFDTVASVSDLTKDKCLRKYIEISLLDENHQAYWYEGYLDEDYQKIADINNYIVTGSDIDQVTSYFRGVAMLDKAGNVSLYGYDLISEVVLSGEIYFEGVENVFSGDDILIIVYKNGDVEYYGFDSWKDERKFIKS